MYEYESAYRSLGLPDALIDCALGRIPIPAGGWATPSAWYGFPPALVPIASNGSGPDYLGCWKHWFSSRHPTFVKMYVDSGRVVIEIARTPAQFFCHLAMEALVVDDGVTSRLQAFADAVGMENLSELDAVSLTTGDDPLGFPALPQFAADPPLSAIRDAKQYTGDFPTGSFRDDREWWHDCCSFEITGEILKVWPDEVPCPRWLLPGSKVSVFNDMLNQGDLHGAWMTLNSSGWRISEAKAALAKLVLAANSSEFTILASAWSSVADSASGCY